MHHAPVARPAPEGAVQPAVARTGRGSHRAGVPRFALGADAGIPTILRTPEPPAAEPVATEERPSPAGDAGVTAGEGDAPDGQAAPTAPRPAAPCDPRGLARADYLKEPGTSVNDFGLTSMTVSTADMPRLETKKAPGGRGFVVPKTPDVMPPISSVFTSAGTFDEGEVMLFGEGECPGGRKYPVRWLIAADGAAKIREGEIEHCADFTLAWQNSMARYAAVINGLAASGKRFASHAQAAAHVKGIVGPHPDDWLGVFQCLLRKSLHRDGGGGGAWHRPRIVPGGKPMPPRLRDGCTHMRAFITAASLPEVGKHPSADVIKDCDEGPPAAKGAKSPAKQGTTTPPAKPVEGRTASPLPRFLHRCGGGCGCSACSAGAPPGYRLSQPTDAAEQEADAIADRVLHRAPSAPARPADAGRTRFPGGVVADAPVVPAGGAGLTADGPAGPVAGARDPRVVPAGGARLPDTERTFFEPRFGHDLGHVRVHADDAAAHLAKRFHARAYAVGRDIVFGRGEFRPSDPAGRRLLAHELAHTLQDAGGALPRAIRRTSFSDCTDDQQTTLRTAVRGAIADIDAALPLLRADPLSSHTEHALWLAFRSKSRATADTVIEKLEAIRDGLPDATIECEQPDDFGYDLFCGTSDAYVRAVSAFTGIGSIHICMGGWNGHSERYRRTVIIHEGSHRFNNTDDEAYFASDCVESAASAQIGRSDRLDNADSYACVVHHLLHSTQADMESAVEDYTGESLGGIDQAPAGAIDLNAADSKKPLFAMRKKDGPIAFIPGIEYRWIIRDAADRRYLMIGFDGESVKHFGNHVMARIGLPTRALLRERGITEATVLCRAKIPRRDTRLFSLDVRFTT